VQQELFTVLAVTPPVDGRLREELVALMSAAILEVHTRKGESSDNGTYTQPQDHAAAS